jgi:hypothetical protein
MLLGFWEKPEKKPLCRFRQFGVQPQLFDFD